MSVTIEQMTTWNTDYKNMVQIIESGEYTPEQVSHAVTNWMEAKAPCKVLLSKSLGVSPNNKGEKYKVDALKARLQTKLEGLNTYKAPVASGGSVESFFGGVGSTTPTKDPVEAVAAPTGDPDGTVDIYTTGKKSGQKAWHMVIVIVGNQEYQCFRHNSSWCYDVPSGRTKEIRRGPRKGQVVDVMNKANILNKLPTKEAQKRFDEEVKLATIDWREVEQDWMDS